ncbi:MAG: hypothetical protein ACJ8DC_20925, partial [Gemmatimonadales bacterium]
RGGTGSAGTGGKGGKGGKDGKVRSAVTQGGAVIPSGARDLLRTIGPPPRASGFAGKIPRRWRSSG